MGKQRIDEAIEIAGNKDKYQKVLTAFFFFVFYECNMIMYGQSFIYLNPIFQNSAQPYELVNEQIACSNLEKYKIKDSFTITTQQGLYCDRQWERDIIQTMYPLGAAFGLIILNMIADVHGKKFAILFALFLTNLGTLFQILGGFAHITVFLMIGQLLLGFSTFSVLAICYVLLSDFTSNGFRQQAMVIADFSIGLGAVTLGVLYYLQIDWSVYLIFINLVPITLLLIGLYFFMLDSPYILANKNKKQQCLQVLLKLSQINQKSNLQKQKIKQIIQDQQDRDEQTKASVKNVLRVISEKQNLITIILIALIYSNFNMNLYGTQYALSQEGYGFGINNIIAGVIEIVAFFLLHFVVQKISRNKGMGITFTFVFLMGISFFFKFVSQNQILASSLLGFMRLFLTFAYLLLSFAMVESFPVEVQATAAGIILIFSLIGFAAVSYVISFAHNNDLNEVGVLSLFLILSIFPNLFLKDSKDNMERKQNLSESPSNQYQTLQEQFVEENRL